MVICATTRPLSWYIIKKNFIKYKRIVLLYKCIGLTVENRHSTCQLPNWALFTIFSSKIPCENKLNVNFLYIANSV